MEQLEYIIMDGVISVMISIIAQLKLVSFVISWDTLELQATQELDLSGVYWSQKIINKFYFYSYGTDYLSMKWDDVNCASSSYLSIAQCSYSTYISGYSCIYSNSYDATVYCCKIIIVKNFALLHCTDTTRIWNSNPFPGMVRLQGGAYSNEGRVEVYCTGQWGTICSTGFGTTDANTICKQLGYDAYDSINYISS